MAKCINRIQILGHLGDEPEIRQTAGGERVANFSVATTERWKGRDGQTQEHTEWHRVTLFGAVADVAAKYLHRGSRVLIEGSVRTEKWTDKSGQERQTVKVRGRDLTLLDAKEPQSRAEPESPPPDDTDVPF